MKRVPYEEMVRQFARVLSARGFAPQDAQAAATIFAQNSLAGVYSHGLNRFPRLVGYLERGVVDPTAKATCDYLRSPDGLHGAVGRAPWLWPFECLACDGPGLSAG